MKKLFLTLAVAFASLAANAQLYVGGEVGAWRNTDDNKTDFNLKPEIGYQLNDKWDLGIGIGFSHKYRGAEDGEYNVKTNSFYVDPYARWSFVKFGPVRMFLDITAGVGTSKRKHTVTVLGEEKTISEDADVAWRVGVQPGVAVGLCKNLDFIAHVGFIGYTDADKESSSSYGKKGFGFDLSSNNLNFGFVYKF